MSKKEEIREKIKNTSLKSKQIYINRWKEKVIVRELNALQFTEISENCVVDGVLNNKLFIILAIIYSTYTIEGENIWGIDDIEDVKNLTIDIFSLLSASVVELNNLEATNKQKK